MELNEATREMRLGSCMSDRQRASRGQRQVTLQPRIKQEFRWEFLLSRALFRGQITKGSQELWYMMG